MKLLRVLIIFLAITLFAGCEVWISFWGDADGDRNIYVRADYTSVGSIGTGDYLRASLFRRDGGTYSFVGRINAPLESEVLIGGFTGLPVGQYKVAIWNDSNGDGNPGYAGIIVPEEPGVTVGPIDISAFVDYTVVVDSFQDWTQDGSASVTAP